MTITISKSLPPGPKPMFAVGRYGNALQFFLDPIGYMRSLYQRCGPLATFVQGYQRWVFIFGPEYNRLVLTNPALFQAYILNLPNTAGTALQRTTSGLLSMNGDIHKQQRRLMLPAFHRKQIEAHHSDIVAITRRMLDRWPAGQELDIAQEMLRLTRAIVSKTLFGLDGAQDGAQLGQLIERGLTMLASASTYVVPFDLPGTAYRRVLRLAERIEQTLLEIIAQKRASLAEQHDLLALLIQAHDEDGTRLTDIELVGQANLLFVAGHETSSNALTWTLFLLSQHPRVAAALLDELDATLHGAAPTIEQLGQLTLLEQVIKESMRLLPAVSYGQRVSTAPFELGPYAFPAGAIISFSQYITHHMPQLYPEPERFRPERWVGADPSPYHYLVFGAGAHSCLGATLAMIEIKIVLAMIMQRYRLALRPGARIDRHMRVTLAPKYGMPMILAPQDGHFTRGNLVGNIHEMVDLSGD